MLEPKELRRYDRYIHYAIKSAEEAIQDAKINSHPQESLRYGVIYGSGMGGINTLDSNIGGFFAGDGTPRYNPFFIPMIITNMAAGMLAIRYGFKGVNFALCKGGFKGIFGAGKPAFIYNNLSVFILNNNPRRSATLKS